MGEMIDAIAHQWRQPLAQANMILLCLEDEIAENKLDKIVVQEQISELFGLTAHLSKTIDDFRSLLTADKPKETFEIQESIIEVLALIKGSLKGIEVQVDVSQKTSILMHKNELMQVLITLLSNSIEALNSQDIEDKKIMIEIEEDLTQINISLEDNAGGIPKAIENKIFDPYFTTKKSEGGTGLGLYIVKIIIEESMRGSITQSKGKKGAKFSIRLKR
jgi:C4-dicarboxylate-specific signal transduction histidine kinase